MKLTNYFTLSRFWLLLKLEFFGGKKAVGMLLVITFGLLFLVGFLLDNIVDDIKVVFDHNENFIYTLLIGGFILSSLAFNETGNTLKRYHYLTLPVSTFEKFVSMWLLTSVGWVFVFTLLYWLYTLIANPIGSLLFQHMEFKPFNPFDNSPLITIRCYLVLQGIFLLGAAHFKGYVFPKTLFALVIFVLILAVFTYFILQDSFMLTHECYDDHCEVVDRIADHKAWLAVTWLFWWVLAPLCWVMTYVGLREQEA